VDRFARRPRNYTPSGEARPYHCFFKKEVIERAEILRRSGLQAHGGMHILSRVTRWPSGWNVDRHKRDDDGQDRIKRDFRDVETSTSPHLYSLLVHVRSPSIVNRPTQLSL
jgi:hypothetical protein